MFLALAIPDNTAPTPVAIAPKFAGNTNPAPALIAAPTASAVLINIEDTAVALANLVPSPAN